MPAREEERTKTFTASMETTGFALSYWSAPEPYDEVVGVGSRAAGVTRIRLEEEVLRVERRALMVIPAHAERTCFCGCSCCDEEVEVPEERYWRSTGTTSYRVSVPNFDVPRDDGIRQNPDGSWSMTTTITLT